MNYAINKYRAGIWSGVLLGLSILSCYGTIAMVAVLGLIGIQFNIHEGIWASVIVVLAWAAVVGIVFEFRRLGAKIPLIFGILGALLITTAMFISYNRIVEISGFTSILAAVIWKRRFATNLYQKES